MNSAVETLEAELSRSIKRLEDEKLRKVESEGYVERHRLSIAFYESRVAEITEALNLLELGSIA